MKSIIIILMCFVPFFVLADTYQDAAGTSQMIADSFIEMWDFFFDDVPSAIERALGWLIIWIVKARIYAQKEFIELSWGIAKVIIADLQILSKITAQISLLPPDIRQALVDMRLFDALNIVLHAYVTRYVMRFIS